MQKFDHWWLPSHEKHLQGWMLKVNKRVDGRLTYQYHKYEAMVKHCKQHRIAVDGGAHCGLFSFWFARDFASVFAFEPVAEHRACFEKNLTGMTQHVHLKAMALGAEGGSISMATEHGSSGNSTVAGKGDIPMVTLDSLELQNVDCWKLDLEGWEENALRGGVETLKQWKPVVMVEQKGSMSKRFGLETKGAVTFLKSLGYVQAVEISGDHVLVHPEA